MSPIQYRCSRCGHIMNEFHGTCPSCGVYLYTKQGAVQPVKPYTKISFRNDIIVGIVFLLAGLVGFFIWFPGRTGKVNDSGPIFLIGLAVIIGFSAIMMAFDKRDKAAGKEPKTLSEMVSLETIILIGVIVITILSVGLGVVGIINRNNPNWRGAMGCLMVPVILLFFYLYTRYEAWKKKK